MDSVSCVCLQHFIWALSKQDLTGWNSWLCFLEKCYKVSQWTERRNLSVAQETPTLFKSALGGTRRKRCDIFEVDFNKHLWSASSGIGWSKTTWKSSSQPKPSDQALFMGEKFTVKETTSLHNTIFVNNLGMCNLITKNLTFEMWCQILKNPIKKTHSIMRKVTFVKDWYQILQERKTHHVHLSLREYKN